MAIIDELITDRTQADVDALKEILNKIKSGNFTAADMEFFKTPQKGAYNFEDLNRVGEAVNTLAELFSAQGYEVAVSAKTNWQMADIPRTTDIAAYLVAVKKIRDVLEIDNALPKMPTTILNFEQANRLEQILERVDFYLQSLIAEFRFCGTFYSGEDDYR